MSKINKSYLFFLIFGIMFFASSFLIIFIPNAASMDIILYNTVGQLLLFVPLIVVCLFIAKEPIRDIFMFNKISFLDIILSIVLAMAIQPAMTLLSLISTLFFPNNVSEYLYQAADSPLIFSVISVAVIPALFEELFFRGLIFSQLKNISLKKASIIAGILFGLGHFSPQQFLYAFAMGTLACVIVYKTKSIFPTMILHFTINFSQLLLSRIDYSELSDEISTTVGEAAAAADISISQMILPYLIFTAISIPIIALIMMLIGRKYGRSPINKAFVLDNTTIIEDETVFDYNPEPGYEEKPITILTFIILLFYIAVCFLAFYVSKYM